MSAKYQAPFSYPEDFPAVIKAFTREVLRAQVMRGGSWGSAVAVAAPSAAGQLPTLMLVSSTPARTTRANLIGTQLQP